MFNFVNNKKSMEITSWYKSNFDSRIKGRYLNLSMLLSVLENYENVLHISSLGLSEEGREIPLIEFGNGRKKVLAWSQMHGNESTTTKAILDFLKFVTKPELFSTEVSNLLNKYTFYIVPMLNPDGAEKYARLNANEIDLNRDAQERSQLESKALRKLFDTIQPHLCLNLHDQRSMYGFKSGLPATVSFLSPASDLNRTITPQREVAMKLIANMDSCLQEFIPNQVGRYDDSFNSNCVGDSFSMLGVPTILFEAGHYNQDYKREKTREFIFYAFLSLFGVIESSNKPDIEDYNNIPENETNFCDILLHNYKMDNDEIVSIAVQYREVKEGLTIHFVPEISTIGNLTELYGHKTFNMENLEIIMKNSMPLAVNNVISHIINKNGNVLPFLL